MMEVFLNPWFMVAGGAMVSSPIIIHLINRMRFKRLRWAAMEFLLKAYKKQRRYLIIKQLILLLLRILLVALTAFLVARYIGSAFGVTPTASTTHLVLLDDTVSMRDRSPRAEGAVEERTAFKAAKEEIRRLAQSASEASSKQILRLMTMSDRQIIFDKQLNATALEDLKTTLDRLEPTAAHVDPLPSIDEALKLLAEDTQSKRNLHIVADFREADWGRRTATEALHKRLEEEAEAGTYIKLVDTADPERTAAGNRAVEHHNNYAITDLRPEKRVAPAGSVIAFSVDVENFGNVSAEAVFVEVFVDGKEDLEASRIYPAPAPGARLTHRFDMLFDGPPEGVASRYHRVTARLKQVDPEAGLKEDNVRHAVIEIRREVPTLVVDGNPGEGVRPGGDTSAIRNALESARGSEAVKVVSADVEELKRPDLEREYATIYLLNLENLKGKKDKNNKGEELPLERLRQYVKNGGNVVFFTGEKIDVAYYNKVLFEENKGLFPVPLEKAATDRISDDDIKKRRDSSAPKIFILDREHDISRGLAGVQYRIPDLIIAQHTPTRDRFEWDRNWATPGDLKELITLSAMRKLEDSTRGQAKRLLDSLDKVTGNDATLAKYKTLLDRHKDEIKKAWESAGTDELYKVAEAFDNMLNEPGDNPGDKDNVSLKDFWNLPQVNDLRTAILDYRKDAMFGSPLVVTRKYGKGNVVAFLTTAGTKWNGWSGSGGSVGGKEPLGGTSSFSFPMIIVDLQKFLTRGGDTGERFVGEPLRFELEANQFQGRARRFVQVEEGPLDPGREPDPEAPLGFKSEPEKTQAAANEGKFGFTFDNRAATGVHMVRVYPQKKDAPPEERWFAYNIDTRAESNLRRAQSEEMTYTPTQDKEKKGSVVMFNVAASHDLLRERQSDTSESPWLYVIILLVLIAEQALAVHLSFHLKGGDTPAVGRPAGQPAAA